MKQLYLTTLTGLFITFTSSILQAQDIIVLKTGEKIEAQIIEINDTEIKYREYQDSDGIIFTIARGKISEVRYAFGKREKEVRPGLEHAYYVDDRINAVKLNFTALADATTLLLYERGLAPGSSIEGMLKLNGLGFNNDFEKRGFGLAVGYKAKLGSLFKQGDSYRPKHFLAGGYFKPSIGFNSVSTDFGQYEDYFYVHLGFDVGVQWVIQNTIVLDAFMGFNYYGGNFDARYTGDTGGDGTIDDGYLFGSSNSALSIGVNVGGIFGKYGDTNQVKKRR